jgi:hypothetical protein
MFGALHWLIYGQVQISVDKVVASEVWVSCCCHVGRYARQVDLPLMSISDLTCEQWEFMIVQKEHGVSPCHMQ